MNQRLRIAHILLSKGFAGTERSTVESCNNQSKHHDVLLVIRKNQTKKSGAGIRQHLCESVEVVEVSGWCLTRTAIQKTLDEWQPDIVHAHLRRSTRILSKCSTRAARISTLHIGFNGAQFHKMDGLIAISPWQLEHIPGDYKGKVRWIRNSLTPHPRPQPAYIEKFRTELGASPDTFIVGGVGRLSKSKGWDILIKAFKLAALDDSLLVLIGEGSQKKSLQILSENHNNIRFMGYKHNVKDYYGAFDVFVCPSREEPMGRVVLEALDAGVKVIASDIEGPKDMLKEYPGKLFKSEDINSLAEALIDAYENKSIPAPKTNLSAHHVKNITAEMLDYYFELIEDRKTNK